jgi:hypothetical protein
MMRWCGVLLLVLVATALAAGPTGVVRGTVTAGAQPLAGARVVLDSAADSSYTGTTTTDPSGRFVFADAPVGAVELRVYVADDRLVARAAATVPGAGQTVVVAIEVKQ